MEYIERQITDKLRDYTKYFPVVFLTGPRQSGKSTLLENVFPEYNHVNLEEEGMRAQAKDDPKGFLEGLGTRAIIDEAQHVPELFSYIQLIVDDIDEPGMFILSGSQNFLLLRKISQSLAGRVGILSLLPFSDKEMGDADLLIKETDGWLFSGHYPRRALKGFDPFDFYSNYIRTYVERDVRMETGIVNLDSFSAFMRICATNVGSPINLSSIGNAIDTDARTISSWLNILEESYIVFRLRPFTKSKVMRYSKTPKIYFYDTGLLCNLLGVKNEKNLSHSNMRGQVYENAIILDYYKHEYNSGRFPYNNTFFWRNSGRQEKEIDLIIEEFDQLKLYEIKSSRTFKTQYADNLHLFEKNIGSRKCEMNVIYDGSHSTVFKDVRFIGRRDLEW